MSFLNRFERGELKLTRVEAFSDGVFAIVVTLLVLELKVPPIHFPDSAWNLAHELRALLPKFVSWLISFIIVCKFWLNHHHLLNFARHANYAMVWLNSLFLMCQAFIPFPTALMGDYPGNPLAVSLFGIVMAGNTVMFMALQSYIMNKLIKPELASQRDPNLTKKSWVGPLSYLVGAGIGWFSGFGAFVVYLITPLFFIVPAGEQANMAKTD